MLHVSAWGPWPEKLPHLDCCTVPVNLELHSCPAFTHPLVTVFWLPYHIPPDHVTAMLCVCRIKISQNRCSFVFQLWRDLGLDCAVFLVVTRAWDLFFKKHCSQEMLLYLIVRYFLFNNTFAFYTQSSPLFTF